MEHFERARHVADLVAAVLAGNHDVLLARGQPRHLGRHRTQQAADSLVDIALRHQRDERECSGNPDPREQQRLDEIRASIRTAIGLPAQRLRHGATRFEHRTAALRDIAGAAAARGGIAGGGIETADLLAEIAHPFANGRKPLSGGRGGVRDRARERCNAAIGGGEFVECGTLARSLTGRHQHFGMALAFGKMDQQAFGLDRLIMGAVDAVGAVAEFNEAANREQPGTQRKAEVEGEEQGDLAPHRKAFEPCPQAASTRCWRCRPGRLAFGQTLGCDIHGEILESAHAASSSAIWWFCSSIRRSISDAGRAR